MMMDQFVKKCAKCGKEIYVMHSSQWVYKGREMSITEEVYDFISRGYTDSQISILLNYPEEYIRQLRNTYKEGQNEKLS